MALHWAIQHGMANGERNVLQGRNGKKLSTITAIF